LSYFTTVASPRSSFGFVALGFSGGTLYAMLDYTLDAMLGAGTLRGSLATFHSVALFILPCVTGAVLGLMVHSRRVRASAAAALRERLERIEREQVVWMLAASVLHDVNNPLHAMGLLLDEALAEREDPLLVRVREHVDRIGQHLGRLRELPRSGQPGPRAVRMDDLVRGVLDARSARLTELRIATRSHLAAHTAWADSDYVRIVIENLVDNAIRALRAAGDPRVLELSVTCWAGRVRLEVRDNGPGLSLAQPQLFEPFRSGFDGGLGLGLSIARALAHTMQGDVTLVRSRPGDTVFALALPQVQA